MTSRAAHSDDDYDDPYKDFDVCDDNEEDWIAEMSCGEYADGSGCSLAGTEWCDWNCPFSAALFKRLRAPVA